MEARTQLTFGILTVSDRCYANEAEDKSGAELKRLLEAGEVITNGIVTWTSVVPDDISLIQESVKGCCDVLNLNVLLITGGTGLAPRDVTPDALRGCIKRYVPGMSYLILQEGLQKTPHAALSRAVVGVRGKTLIASLPGSLKGSVEGFKAIAPVVPHAVDLIVDNTEENSNTHQEKGSDELVIQSKVVVETDEKNRVRASSYPTIQKTELPVLFKYSVSQLGVRLIRTEDALGYVLAKDAVSAEDIPQFRTSMKDGYAIGKIGSVNSGRYQVIGEYFPGGKSKIDDACSTPEFSLDSAQAVKVSTGSPVPPGTFSVVPVEAIALVTGPPVAIELKKTVYENSDIRKIGSDVRIGQVVLQRETLISASNVSTLAAIGKYEIPVICKPVVAVLSCGDELQEMWGPLHPFRVRDNNKVVLTSLIKSWGFRVVDLGIVADEPNAVLKSLKDGCIEADVIITTGGMSTGHRDIVKSVLVEDLGAKIHFGRLDVKALELTGFGTFYDWQGQRMKHWFGVPGDPKSAFIAAHMVVRPVLKLLSGRTKDIFYQRIKATAAYSIDSTKCKTLQYRRGHLKYETPEGTFDGKPVVCIEGMYGMSNFINHEATCLVEIPCDCDAIRAKSEVFVTLLE